MKIKICGICRNEDAEFLNKAMPDFAGFVFYPKSRRFTDDAAAAKLRKILDSRIKTVGVFVDDSIEHIKALCDSGTISIVQLHGGEDEGYISALRTAVPFAEIWKAFLIKSSEDITAARNSSADMILTDNGFGTGEIFDWSLIANIGRDFILAGGLTPDSIPTAAERFNPWAVDISSGAESNGVKDEEKITAAVKAARQGGNTHNV